MKHTGVVLVALVTFIVSCWASSSVSLDEGVPLLERIEGNLTLIPTPFGWRPKQCVHRNVGNGVVIRRAFNAEGMEQAVEIFDPLTGDVRSLPILAECVAWEAKMYKERLARRKNQTSGDVGADGWLDNASYTTPGLVGSFDGDYRVPSSPAQDSNQVLFWFIGTVNFKGGSGETILQPVLQFNNAIRGWSMASWNCCPGGQTHESTPFVGFGPGANIYGGIDESGTTWKVISALGSKQTSLSVPDAGREFEWVDATLETYGVKNCAELPKGEMQFYNMRLKLANGQTIDPKWGTTGATECNGRTQVYSPDRVGIFHN